MVVAVRFKVGNYILGKLLAVLDMLVRYEMGSIG